MISTIIFARGIIPHNYFCLRNNSYSTQCNKVIYTVFTSHTNPPPAAVLRSPCPLPRHCLLPLATAAPKRLPPLTTTPAAACHLAQHNSKGGVAPSIAASSLLPLANNNKGGEAWQQPLPPMTTRGDEVAACRCRHRHHPPLQLPNVVFVEMVRDRFFFSF